jgi:hypothetical protein
LDGPIAASWLLVGLLALFCCLGAASCGFGFGFFFGSVALGVGLVLLGLAFAGNIVATRDVPDGFLRFAFGVLDGSLDGFPGPAVFLGHDSSLVPIRDLERARSAIRS